ncbi:MAG: InlB B-repeat-containing protein, partial [Clostridia bacterium]|nr:InlB B-repeat-containing protein [Clostridia bacterium]
MKEQMRRFLCLLLCVLMLGSFIPGSSANEVFVPAEGASGGCDIYVLLNPEIAGEVTGEGTYAPGASVTLTPTANQGFVFLWWEEDGEFLSSAVPLTFTAETSRELSAVFDTAVTVLWLDGDDSVLDSQVYAFWSLTEGEVTPSTDAVPSKAADDDYTYSFTGWNEGDWDETETDMFFIFTPNFDPTPIVKHTLTILYQYEDGTQAAPTHTALLAEDAEYAVDSPEVRGFAPDQETVAGAMGEKDVTVTVTYTALTYAATVENGSGSGDYAAGETVNIAADDPEEGAQFKEWTTQDDLAIDSPTSAETFFIMPDHAVTVTATYEDIPVTTYAVTVENGEGDGDYEEGATVSISADAPAEGRRFKEWTTQDGVAFANAASAETSFVMPARAVTVTATYEEIPTHTVIFDGNGGAPETANVAVPDGEHVQRPADPTRQGYIFRYWMADDGHEFDFDKTITNSITLYAQWVEGNSKPSQSENGGNAGWSLVPATAPAGTAAAETSVQAETSVKADGSTETKQLETSTETKTNQDGSVTVTDTVKETVTTENDDGSKVEVITDSETTETTASIKNEDGSVTDTTKVTCTETVTEKIVDANGRVSTAETKTEQEKSTDVTATENEDGTVTEKTETKETVKVTEKVTDDRGNVTEFVTETTREETVQLTFREDGSATGTSTATSV